MKTSQESVTFIRIYAGRMKRSASGKRGGHCSNAGTASPFPAYKGIDVPGYRFTVTGGDLAWPSSRVTLENI